MSQKITSKNLAYEDKVPPFLAALRAQASGSSGPDPLLASRRRATKKRSKSEEAEDAPLVVDEHGNQVSLDLGADGEPTGSDAARAPEAAAAGAETTAAEDTAAARQETDRVAGIGGSRKRKAAKVIKDEPEVALEKHGEERDKEDDAADKPAASGKKPEGAARDKLKKKPKKIKLSFDEEGN